MLVIGVNDEMKDESREQRRATEDRAYHRKTLSMRTIPYLSPSRTLAGEQQEMQQRGQLRRKILEKMHSNRHKYQRGFASIETYPVAE